LKDKLKNIESNSSDANEKITNDLDFYKRSYEEQKNRVNKEHEMISSSLYELALQFMSLKSELQKKMTTGSANDTTHGAKK
jgi:hypothetical protein